MINHFLLCKILRKRFFKYRIGKFDAGLIASKYCQNKFIVSEYSQTNPFCVYFCFQTHLTDGDGMGTSMRR